MKSENFMDIFAVLCIYVCAVELPFINTTCNNTQICVYTA